MRNISLIWTVQYNWIWAREGQTVGSFSGFYFETSSDESLLVPLVGGEHVAAIMDTEDRHLISVLKILQQLETMQK